MGGQEQFADGQGQSFGGQGLYVWWAGAVMLRNHEYSYNGSMSNQRQD